MLWLALVLSQPAFASEIKVSLFGQPCVLNGPADEATLQTIHSISPEKIPTPETADQARRDLAALRKITTVPTDLDRYRDLLTKRLEAHQIFFEALAAAKREGKPDSLFEAVKPVLEAKRFHEFQAAVRKLWKSPKAIPADQIAEKFERAAPPDPEEEFHRAIRRMKVAYTCTFEDGEHAEDGEEDDAAEPTPAVSGSPAPR